MTTKTIVLNLIAVSAFGLIALPAPWMAGRSASRRIGADIDGCLARIAKVSLVAETGALKLGERTCDAT